MDVETVRHALLVARRSGFAEVELRSGDDRFRARLESVPAEVVQKMVPSLSTEESALLEIKSPLVGYYRPGKAPLAAGAKVAKGDKVASIEALGLLSDVESRHTGEVVEVLVEDGQPIQYGQVIARVKA